MRKQGLRIRGLVWVAVLSAQVALAADQLPNIKILMCFHVTAINRLKKNAKNIAFKLFHTRDRIVVESTFFKTSDT